MIVVGAIVVFEPDLLTAQLDLFASPSVEDIIYAAVVATIAYTGIEAASDLAPDLDFEPEDLRRVLSAGAVIVPADVRGYRRDRADGGACAADPGRSPDRARRVVRGGAGPGGGAGVRPPVDRRRHAVGRGAGGGAGADLGREHRDARGLAPRLRARDQPPDPELGRAARAHSRDALRRDRHRRADGPGSCGPGRHRVPGGGVRVRCAARGNDRASVGDPAAVHRPRPRAAVRRAAQRDASGAGSAAARGVRGGGERVRAG